MCNKALVQNVLEQIQNSVQTVLKRFESIKKVSDFTFSPEGMEKLDAICMQLIAIGEGLKNLDKLTDNNLLINYPQIDWKGAKAMRDIISHHYFEVDAEIIFNVCQTKLPILNEVLNRITEDLDE